MTYYQIVTVIVLIVAIVGLAIYDIWVWSKGGGDATISKMLLNAAKKFPIVAVIFGLSIGVLLGHLFWPQHIYHICN